MACVLPLTDARVGDAALAGTKAARLGELLRAGFPVPPGFVLGTTVFEQAAARSEGGAPRLLPDERALVIREAGSYRGPFAVRSSGAAEDLPGASFAGQYETLLKVDVEGLPAAIEACWASASSLRVAAYRLHRGVAGPVHVAVLVQEMVPARAAGVAFTANPRTGDRDETVINAVSGLGERLVSGEATAEEWAVRGRAVRRSGRGEAVLTTAEAAEVAQMARAVAAHYGGPQDIEWALDGSAVHLLQARPITALGAAISWRAPEPGLWLRAFRLGEWLGAPVTPLFASWLLRRMEARLFREMEGVVPQGLAAPFHVIVNGWYFTTGNFTPRSVPHALVLALRHLLPAAIRRPKAVSVLISSGAHIGMAHFERLWREGPKGAYEDLVREASARVAACDELELPALIDALGDAAGAEAFLFFMSGGSAWKAEVGFAGFYRRYLAVSPEDTHQVLLQGLTAAPLPGGHAVLSLDWHEPTLAELGLAGNDADDGRRRARAAQRRHAAEAAARRRLEGKNRLRRRFDRLLERAQRFGRLREEQAHHLTLAWPTMRAAVRRLGRTLSERAVLAHPDDIFFLLKDELDAALAGEGAARDLASLVARRKAELEEQQRLTPPDHVGSMSRIQRAIFRGSARAIAGGGHAAGRGSLVSGSPASPGRVAGHARVILSAEAFHRLAEGDILVAPATNPGWTPLFARAAAVVTDSGSLMAHASLVAREYGIPAVVGCGNATSTIRDGQLIAVDGTAGTVELLG